MRKHRAQEQRYFIEGIRIVQEALERRAPVETLVYCPDQLLSERALALVDLHPEVEHIAVSAQVFASLSERDEPQGLAAVVRMSPLTVTDIPLRPDLLVVVAWQLQTPGNLGSIIRTADAAGAHGVIIVEPSVDLYDPDTVRATMGSLYAIPIATARQEPEFGAWLAGVRAAGKPLRALGTSAHGTALVWDVDCRGPLAILIGSEKDGLSEYARSMADVVARLPMAGSASSLNVSAAAAAVIFEAVRQRRADRGPDR
jgi:TrmH family RNA methyltransferase